MQGLAWASAISRPSGNVAGVPLGSQPVEDAGVQAAAILNLRKDILGTCPKLVSGRRKFDAPGMSVKQPRPKLPFELGHLAAQHGLGNAKLQRGACEAARLCNR
jgi:hypothetical protein